MMKSVKRSMLAVMAAALLLISASASNAAEKLKAVEGSGRDASEALFMLGSNKDVKFELPENYTVKSVKGEDDRVLYQSYWQQSGNLLSINMTFSHSGYVIPLKVACVDSSSNEVELTGSILIRGEQHWLIAVNTPQLKTSDPSIDLTLTTKLPDLVSQEDLVRRTGMPASCFTSGEAGTEMGSTYEGGYGLSLEGLARVFGTYSGYTGLQSVSGSTVRSGDILAVAYNVRGSYLADSANGSVAASEAKVWKVLGANEKRQLTFASTNTGFRDGTFAIFNQTEAGRPDAISLEANDTISLHLTYVLVVFIQDGGAYDLARDEDFLVVDPIVVQKTLHQTRTINSNGGGCTASGFGALFAAALFAHLAARRRDKRKRS